MSPVPKSDKAAMCLSLLMICVGAPTDALGPPGNACLQTKQANPNRSCRMHDALPDTEKDGFDSSGILRRRESSALGPQPAPQTCSVSAVLFWTHRNAERPEVYRQAGPLPPAHESARPTLNQPPLTSPDDSAIQQGKNYRIK